MMTTRDSIAAAAWIALFTMYTSNERTLTVKITFI